MFSDNTHSVRLWAVVLLPAFPLAGCAQHTVGVSLATLSNGDRLHVHEVREGYTVRKRKIIVSGNRGATESLSVAAGDDFLRRIYPYGWDVLQSGDDVTVWRIEGDREIPLATLNVGSVPGRRVQAPKSGLARNGTRAGCRVYRVIASADLGEEGQIKLFMHSMRDDGSNEERANSDSLWLDWNRGRWVEWTYHADGLGTGVLRLTGSDCVPDPFVDCPRVDIRWHPIRDGVWGVDRDTGRVLGGIQYAGPRFFDRDGTPKWATATTGTVVASTVKP